MFSTAELFTVAVKEREKKMAEASVPATTGADLLSRFSNQQLGEVTRPGRGAEDLPGQPQQERGAETGRRPEELIPQREVAEQQTRNDDDDTEKLLQERYKVRTGYDADGVVVQEDLTLEEIARRGLMAKIVSSANQLPNVSRKNAELQAIVEKVAVEKTAPAAPAKPAPPTQQQIYDAFLPMLNEFVKLGHVEGDLAEAYPQAMTGAMYNTARLNTIEESMVWIVDWIKAEAAKRDHAATYAHINAAMDKVAAMADGDKGDRFYAGLKDPVKREAFITWLRKDIDPKVGSITPESVQNHWVTFNAKDLLQFTKEAAKEAAKPDPNPTRKRAGGDGPGARPGKLETPAAPSMLDRFTDYKLGDQQ